VKKEESLQAILDEWRRLPEAEKTENHAAGFAMQMANEYQFRCSGDRYQVIMGFLSRHLSRGHRR
jgi:hypothetical protein